MIKIAMITPGFLPVPAVKGGAIEKLITLIVENNEKYKEMKIDLYTIGDEKIVNGEYKYTNIISVNANKFEIVLDKILNKLFKIFKLKKHSNFYSRKVSKLINNDTYDYIVVENNMYTYKKIYSLVGNKSKFIFHLHNDIGKTDKPKELCKYISDTSYKVIACSNFLKDKFNLITNSNKAEVLYNSIDLKDFNYDETGRNIIRKQYNLKDNDYVFGYVGRISQEKGILELVQAFKKFLERTNVNDCYLIIVGSIWYNQVSHNKYSLDIQKNITGIEKYIKFVGEVPNGKIKEYMSSMDCVVIPTVCEEAFGMVSIEAMACERPVIASNSGGLVEIVDSSCGFIVDRNNLVDNICNKLEYVYHNSAKAKAMGKNGRKKVNNIDNFHSDKFYRNFINIINEE